ncbi:MAG: hypothetical protein LBI29_04190, partial [Rickettsiales bacterium]|nr:hypothetical protein [Rickettsiales bacterium]
MEILEIECIGKRPRDGDPIYNVLWKDNSRAGARYYQEEARISGFTGLPEVGQKVKGGAIGGSGKVVLSKLEGVPDHAIQTYLLQRGNEKKIYIGNETLYEGSLEGGKVYGVGMLTIPDGVYMGEFNIGTIEGYGKL